MRTLMMLMAAALPLVAQEAPPQEQAAETALQQALADITTANSEDFCPAADAVLQAGGTETDYGQLMARAAAAGQPAAQLQLARQLLSGGEPALSAGERAKQARAAVQAAAEQKYLPAMVELARMAGTGVGAPADLKEGTRLLVAACKAGSVRARAAYLLVSGRLDKGNYEAPEIASELKKKNFYLEEIIATLCGETPQSRLWWERATEHGSAQAPYQLSLGYEDNISEQDASAYLKLAAERHQPAALATIGALETGGDGKLVPLDRESGIRHLQEALLLGYWPAAVTLASQYIADPAHYSAERVYSLYRRAADAGEARALVAAAYCLAMGRGCTADPARGREQLKQLALDGQAYAEMALADLAFNGVGGAPDLQEAINALGEAAAQGLPQTYTLMAALTAMGTATTPPDPRRAEVYLKMAEEQGEATPRKLYEALLEEKGWHFLPPC